MKYLLIFFLISFSTVGAPLKGSIYLEIEGLKNDKGVIQVLLFEKSKGFPDSPEQALQQITLPIKSNKVQSVFKDLPFGTYAISCIHDENINQKQDTNFFGYPIEGYGTSKNPSTTWRKPHFDESSFILESNDLKVIIRMNYPLKNE